MPTVPWIRLYQGWQRHRKTIALRKLLGTAEPILCLWLWAAENAPHGELRDLSEDDVERLSEWIGKRGKAVSAMVEVGYLDRSEDGVLSLHNWTKRTGAGVASLLKTRNRMASTMRNVRANKGANVSANSVDNVSANKGANPLTLSDPDLNLGKKDPEGESVSVPVSANTRTRPRTPHELIHCLRVAIQREQEIFWNPGGTFSHKEAQGFLDGFEDLEAAIGDIEKRIVAFAKDPAMRPWTVAKFAKVYNGLTWQATRESIFDEKGRLREHA
jgi:hypothetical protein